MRINVNLSLSFHLSAITRFSFPPLSILYSMQSVDPPSNSRVLDISSSSFRIHTPISPRSVHHRLNFQLNLLLFSLLLLLHSLWKGSSHEQRKGESFLLSFQFLSILLCHSWRLFLGGHSWMEWDFCFALAQYSQWRIAACSRLVDENGSYSSQEGGLHGEVDMGRSQS